jgi:LPS-assembly lipoprotein
MRRRALLGTLALGAGAAAGLSACGFRLRGALRFPYTSVHLASTSPLAQELSAALRGNGVQVMGGSQPPERAAVVVSLSEERRERVIVSRTSSGQVRELQLRLTVRVGARSGRGVDLLTPIDLSQQRDVSYNESAALAKEAEEEALNREMQSELVQQLMRRLATLQPGA